MDIWFCCRAYSSDWTFSNSVGSCSSCGWEVDWSNSVRTYFTSLVFGFDSIRFAGGTPIKIFVSGLKEIGQKRN
jgi:hypothetical protein